MPEQPTEKKQLEVDKDTKTATSLIAGTLSKFFSNVKKKQQKSELKKEEVPPAPTPTPAPQDKLQVSKEKK